MLLTWLKGRMAKALQNDTDFTRLMAAGLWIASGIATVVSGLGNPTGLGLISDLVIYFVLHIMAFFLFTKIVAFILTLLFLPVPRFFVASLLYTGFSVYFILDQASLGLSFSLVVSFFYALAALVLGLILKLLTHRQIKWQWKAVFVFLPLALCVIFIFWHPMVDLIQPVFSRNVTEIVVPHGENPAEPGTYPYRYFTYGSGEDKHRPEFRSEIELLSTSVDASEYLDHWHWMRDFFWGFDQSNFPLNGHVWMPEGEGPFPLVLMTHGNHRMEHFSDDGYGYLGELLASRGFIAITVDQNFLNYSGWSGTPKDDMKLRAWVFMQHLLQIEKFQNTPNTPFYQQVDLHNIALIGHSRGGQAAAMVADYTTWFENDASVSGMEKMGIQAVVGIAPTDKTVAGKKAALENTYYLVLHGAQDGDVNSFAGDRQYARSSFNTGSERFKASLYIGEANHSQFNTAWGSMDSSLPRGLFLNQRDTMKPVFQREVAKVYVAAFLETALHGDDQYVQLFQDYRYGSDWLPESVYFSRFEDGRFIPLADFDRKKDKRVFEQGIKVDAVGFTTWDIEQVKDRQRNNKGFDATVLAWDEASSYSFVITDSFRNSFAGNPEILVLSVANMERDLTSEGDLSVPIPQIEVEIETADRVAVRLPLDEFMPFPPQIYTQYARVAWLDQMMRDGKYSEAAEPVFQTYELPIQAFKQLDPDFQADKITKITLHFVRGPGKVMIDDIGFTQ